MQTPIGVELTSKIARATAETEASLAGETGIFKRLIAEHAEVRCLIEAALAASERSHRCALFEHFRSKLTLHADAEEQEFYSLLEAGEATAETVQIQMDEHRVMAALLATLQNLEPMEDEWHELVGKLLLLFDGHVQREEKTLFVASKPSLDEPESETIESRFEERKVEHAERMEDNDPPQKKYERPLP